MSSQSKRGPKKWLRWTGDEKTQLGVSASIDNHIVMINWDENSNIWIVTYASSKKENAYVYSRKFDDRENAFRWAAKRCGVSLVLGYDVTS